ncbi:hypothetical protein [Parapedobacter koreensis]|uniref:Uncharacterized protein n=1 Tax=Parapedobacter koreensis TaxID=332977 RepID=A0A1H7TX58_9SPHI|nr:hypothetical protein [Parapedobacter koreensis]SEL89048.1 hypothetical protein SAMN05421740_112130 [Parapedobacter koreensis]
METINKIKTVSKIGTLALAAAAYVFLGSNQAGVEVAQEAPSALAQEETIYQTIPMEDGGPVDPQVTGTRDQLKSTVCPDEGTLCAFDPNNEDDILEWNGGSAKF